MGAWTDDSRGDVPRSELCAVFVERLPIDGASVSVVTSAGSHSAVSSSDAVATQLEQLQYDLGEGPHYGALLAQRPVLLPDVRLGDHSRWPMFGHAVAEMEARAVFSFPMRMGAATVGVVDLYRRSPGRLSDPDVFHASALAAGVAGKAMAYAAAEAEGGEQIDAARSAGARRQVHQAIGMMSVQLETSATEAFSRLRGHAYATGRNVDQVARDVVMRVLDFAEPPGNGGA